MSTIVIRWQRLEHGADLPLPAHATTGASGMDLRAAKSGTLHPGSSLQIQTGFAIEIPPGYEGQVRPRSGLAMQRSITVLNSPGTIDADYRGELKVLLVNHGKTPWFFERGDRIAQLVVAEVSRSSSVEVEVLTETSRGERGFGSTGVS